MSNNNKNKVEKTISYEWYFNQSLLGFLDCRLSQDAQNATLDLPNDVKTFILSEGVGTINCVLNTLSSQV